MPEKATPRANLLLGTRKRTQRGASRLPPLKQARKRILKSLSVKLRRAKRPADSAPPNAVRQRQLAAARLRSAAGPRSPNSAAGNRPPERPANDALHSNGGC